MSKKTQFASLIFAFFTALALGNGLVLLDGVAPSHAVHGAVFDKQNRAEQLYGQGVHAFFDNDFVASKKLLHEVEKLGSEDPRPYYFLAMSYLRLNENKKADHYFDKAAQFEWEGRSIRDYNVADALMRIQGNERLKLEKYREKAKTNWQEAEKRRLAVMYKDSGNRAQSTQSVQNVPLAKPALFAGARIMNPFHSDLEAAVAERTAENKANEAAMEAARKVVEEATSKQADSESAEDNSFGNADDAFGFDDVDTDAGTEEAAGYADSGAVDVDYLDFDDSSVVDGTDGEAEVESATDGKATNEGVDYLDFNDSGYDVESTDDDTKGKEQSSNAEVPSIDASSAEETEEETNPFGS